jgi:hypothetical protein
MNPLYAAVAVRARHRCEYCRAPEAVFNFPFEVEHITPKSLGGTDFEANLALACHACNLWKSDHVSGTDPETGGETRLFHPREDGWDEHFRLDHETAMIVGLTSIGKASVNRLQMNSDAQATARRYWLRLGLLD